MGNATSKATPLIPQLEQLLALDVSSLKEDHVTRRRAIHLVRALNAKLESPWDTVLRLSWYEPSFNFALKAALDLGIYDLLGDAGSEFKSIPELSQATGADPTLLRRVLRHLAANGALREREPDGYGATALTAGLRRKEINAGVDHWFNIGAPALSKLPAFLKKTGYKNPTDISDGNWQFAHNTPMNFFEWGNAHSDWLAKFSDYMAGYTSERGSWVDVYPTERIINGADSEGPLLVDVGGSLGHDTEKFRQKHPQESGRLIVQDQPLVVEDAAGKVDKSIEMMSYDFFTPQPVKDARTYFMHSILHDWPDEKALEILRNLKPAFKRGYSKLLLNECVIPRTGAHPQATGMDIFLMGLLSSRERSQADWERLLDEAEFRIVGIWTDPSAYESVIEAELV